MKADWHTILDSKEAIIALMGAMVGSLLGGVFALIGGFFSNQLEICRENKREKRELKAVLQGFHSELKALWERYIDSVGKEIENLPADEPWLKYWSITHDYFILFNSNASMIGKIQNEELREKIIFVYIRAKGIIDSFRMNNELNQKVENLAFTIEQLGNGPLRSQANVSQKAYLKGMSSYANTIKKQHYELKEALEDLLPKLKKASI